MLVANCCEICEQGGILKTLLLMFKIMLISIARVVSAKRVLCLACLCTTYAMLHSGGESNLRTWLMVL